MSACFYVYPCAFRSVSVHSLRFIIPLSSLIFQGMHPQVPHTTYLVMFFPRALVVLGFSTSYTSTKVTQLVMICHQRVDRNLTAAKKKKKKKKITRNSMRLYRKQLQRNTQLNVSPSSYFLIKKKGSNQGNRFPPNREITNYKMAKKFLVINNPNIFKLSPQLCNINRFNYLN